MRYLAILLFCCPLLNPGMLTESSFVPEDGLIAHYTFNLCDARDDSGNESHGQLFGNPGCWCGVEGQGLLLDGRHDYVEFHGLVNKYFNTSDFTVSFYVRSESYSVFRQSMLSKRASCDEYHMLDILLDQKTRLFETKVHETPNKHYANISPEFSGSGWQHFALVREGRYASTFINGILVRQGSRCSGVDISNDTPLSFGNSPCLKSGMTRRFKGIVDELRVYDRALSEEEVRTLYLLHPIEKADADCMS
ncbi:MAG: LamG domain-containing protein [Bacteroidota bacterium]